MSLTRSAFKTQTQKSYGNVEKMYIHFYTIQENTGTSGQSPILNIYWYSSNTENIDLFNDCHTLLKKMKEYLGIQYTGDIFSINNLQEFKENLILLGVETLDCDNQIFKLKLQNGEEIKGNKHIINNSIQFNDLFDVCFQNYDFHSSFSDVNDDIIESGDNDIPIIYIEEIFKCSSKFFLPKIELKCLMYKSVNSSIDNIVLNNWFNTLVKSNKYSSIYNILTNLCSFNKDLEVNTITQDADDGLSIAETINEKISKTEWIKLFCDLYLEEDTNTDILLSDVYQEYVTASSWTDTSVVTMAQFIKQLRALNLYTIKRRSKGMMLIGHISLVSKQPDFKKLALNGSLSNRNIFKYTHPAEVQNTIKRNEDLYKDIGHKYAREVGFLLNGLRIKLDYQTVAQFSSIPYLSTEMEKIARYIDKQIIIKPIEFSNGDIFYNFRKTADDCLVYFPFNTKYYDNSYKQSDLLKTKSIPDNVVSFKDNDELSYYEFGNFGAKAGVDLSWTDTFGSLNPARANLGDFVSTRLNTSKPNRVFKTTKPVPNQQIRKDPNELNNSYEEELKNYDIKNAPDVSCVTPFYQ